MAEGDDDLVALIFSALGEASAGELRLLSESLASESCLQLQRLWLLAGSPSRCLSIISFLDSLEHRHRRLLLARVNLRLVCRITDFLEQVSCHGRSVATAVQAGAKRYGNGGESARFLDSEEDAAFKLPTMANDVDDQQRECNGGDELANARYGEQPWCSANSLQMMVSTKDCRFGLADFVRSPALGKQSASMHALGKQSALMHLADAGPFGNLGMNLANDKFSHVDDEVPFAADASDVKLSFGHIDPFNEFAQKNNADLDANNLPVQLSNMNIGMIDAVPSPLLGTGACLGASFLNFIDAGADLHPGMGGTTGEDNMDGLSRPWGETDAAFLFLFLWESQEQECQEAMRRWCVDSIVDHLSIVQDITVLVGHDKKAGRIRAPRWRECLQQYLQQHILQVGYGFPGAMASANLPASLSVYIDTIGRFQRILESMDVEDSSEQKWPAASAAVLRSLPATVIGLSSEDKGKVCIICKEELECLSVASQLPCMHMYHWDCIWSWLKQRNNCPVCRFELPSDDYDHELQRKIRFLRERVLTVA